MVKRTFTKYPGDYIKASDKVSSEVSMFKKYGLFDYYDSMAGNACIPIDDFESVQKNVMRLLEENEGWVLGYGQKASGYEEDFWYVTDWLE